MVSEVIRTDFKLDQLWFRLALLHSYIEKHIHEFILQWYTYNLNYQYNEFILTLE